MFVEQNFGLGYPGGEQLQRTVNGIIGRDGDLIGILNYPIEVVIAKNALNKIVEAFSKDGDYSNIDVFATLQNGQRTPVCTINCDFFGYVSHFKEVFEQANKAPISHLKNELIRHVDGCYYRYTEMFVASQQIFSTKDFNFIDYYSKLKPRVIKPKCDGEYCLAFPVGFFSIPNSHSQETKKHFGCSLGMQRSFLAMHGVTKQNSNANAKSANYQREAKSETDRIIAFEATYKLGTWGCVDTFPMVNQFCHSNDLGELLQLNMDYQRGQWQLGALQRGPDVLAFQIQALQENIPATVAAKLQNNVSSEPPQEFICPITMEIMNDPVIAQDGHTYEREAISKWLQNHNYSPITREPLDPAILIVNRQLQALIQSWRKQHA